MGGKSTYVEVQPSPPLRRFVTSYVGYRISGYDAGIHVGVPSPTITVIIPFDDPIELAWMGELPSRFGSLASGLGTEPISIFHDGCQHGVQLTLTPVGARVLLGVPASEIGNIVVSLTDLLGTAAPELEQRMASEEAWTARFAVLNEVLTRLVHTKTIERNLEPDRHLMSAWQLLTESDCPRIQAVADEIGWSRRHLITKFRAEFGIAPKDAARVARFDRSYRLLRSALPQSMADISVQCGYYDQAHMAREWREFAGSAPTVWRANEEFAFVQDTSTVPTEQ